MTAPEQPSDLLERLRLGDNAVFGQLYQRHYHPAAAFVKSNSGNAQEARDVFQEALLVLHRYARKKDFHLRVEPGAFLFAIVRKLWLNRLRQRKVHPEVQIDETVHFQDSDINEIELLLREQRWADKHQVVKDLLETLKIECQKLIEFAFYHQFSTAEIARRLGYSESFVKVKKHRCLSALREKLKKHPVFNSDES